MLKQGHDDFVMTSLPRRGHESTDAVLLRKVRVGCVLEHKSRSVPQKPVPNPLELAVLRTPVGANGGRRSCRARRVRIVLHPLSGVARPGAMDAT